MSTGIFNRHTGYHNRRSIRLPGYDYSRSGYYFITICIHDRCRNLFGDIANGKILANKFGSYVKQCWHEIPDHFSHVRLDEFVIMPNHIHGIIRLRECGMNSDRDINAGGQIFVGVQNLEPRHETRRNDKTAKNPLRNQYQHIIPRSIGSIVRGFKIGATKLIRKKIPGIVVWQRNYFEHVIRDENSLYLIRKYIRENPANWRNDHENHIEHEINEFKMAEMIDTKIAM